MNGKRPGGWVALAWRYYRDEKLLAVSADAELLWTHALAFAGEQETDGRIPAGALGLLASKLVGSVGAAAEELVAAGLWHETTRGYSFPGDTWGRWQQTAEQAAASRDRAAERKALWRRRHKSRDAGRDGGQDVAQGQGQGIAHVPVPALESESSEPELYERDGRLYVVTTGQGERDG